MKILNIILEVGIIINLGISLIIHNWYAAQGWIVAWLVFVSGTSKYENK